MARPGGAFQLLRLYEGYLRSLSFSLQPQLVSLRFLGHSISEYIPSLRGVQLQSSTSHKLVRLYGTQKFLTCMVDDFIRHTTTLSTRLPGPELRRRMVNVCNYTFSHADRAMVILKRLMRHNVCRYGCSMSSRSWPWFPSPDGLLSPGCRIQLPLGTISFPKARPLDDAAN